MQVATLKVTSWNTEFHDGPECFGETWAMTRKWEVAWIIDLTEVRIEAGERLETLGKHGCQCKKLKKGEAWQTQTLLG